MGTILEAIEYYIQYDVLGRTKHRWVAGQLVSGWLAGRPRNCVLAGPATWPICRLLLKQFVHPCRDNTTIPHIALTGRPLSTRDMMSLYKASDAFVLPTHGEGW
jgi:hypothetical protein